jgi:hypothetical protein
MQKGHKTHIYIYNICIYVPINFYCVVNLQADMAILELKMSRDKIEQHKKKVLGTMERNRYSERIVLLYILLKKN